MFELMTKDETRMKMLPFMSVVGVSTPGRDLGGPGEHALAAAGASGAGLARGLRFLVVAVHPRRRSGAEADRSNRRAVFNHYFSDQLLDVMATRASRSCSAPTSRGI